MPQRPVVFDADAANHFHLRQACAQPCDDGGVAHHLWANALQRPFLNAVGQRGVGFVDDFGGHMEQRPNRQRAAFTRVKQMSRQRRVVRPDRDAPGS